MPGGGRVIVTARPHAVESVFASLRSVLANTNHVNKRKRTSPLSSASPSKNNSNSIPSDISPSIHTTSQMEKTMEVTCDAQLPPSASVSIPTPSLAVDIIPTASNISAPSLPLKSSSASPTRNNNNNHSPSSSASSAPSITRHIMNFKVEMINVQNLGAADSDWADAQLVCRHYLVRFWHVCLCMCLCARTCACSIYELCAWVCMNMCEYVRVCKIICN